MNKLAYSLCLASAAATTGCWHHGAHNPTADEMIHANPLPMAKGSKWSYDATITLYDVDKDKDVKRTIPWTTEVLDSTTANGVTAYLIKGWPSDLAGFDGTPTPTQRVLLRSGDAFMWAKSDDGSSDPSTAPKVAPAMTTSLAGASGWFTWPLADGQQLCPDPDVVYCWNVKGTDAGYEMSYRTGPDEETFLLQPGTGVANYHYVHHGTTNEVDAKLTDYSPGKSPK